MGSGQCRAHDGQARPAHSGQPCQQKGLHRRGAGETANPLACLPDALYSSCCAESFSTRQASASGCSSRLRQQWQGFHPMSEEPSDTSAVSPLQPIVGVLCTFHIGNQWCAGVERHAMGEASCCEATAVAGCGRAAAGVPQAGGGGAAAHHWGVQAGQCMRGLLLAAVALCPCQQQMPPGFRPLLLCTAAAVCSEVLSCTASIHALHVSCTAAHQWGVQAGQ